jgi:excisionase family DNA binding protein
MGRKKKPLQFDPGEDEFLKAKEFAARLRIAVSTVSFWHRTGRIQIVKAGRLIRIPRSELDRILNARASAQQPAA